MKKFISASLFVLTAAVAVAQKAKPTVKPVVKPVAVTPVAMKNLNDSFSYAAGLNIAANMKEQGIEKVNSTLMAKAISDVFNNKPKALEPEKAKACLNAQLDIYKANKTAIEAKNAAAEQAAAIKAAGPEKEKGKIFLTANKLRTGVVELPSGLQYEIVKEGDGIKPNASDTVVVNYIGKLIDGSEFDSSTKNGGPVTFPVGGVIRGWVEALLLMKKGGHWKVYIPSDLGYGDRGYPPVIPPGATLVFDIMLEDVKPAASK